MSMNSEVWQPGTGRVRPVRIPIGPHWLEGDLAVPAEAEGLVIFAHGSGSSHRSPRNQFVARVLRESGNGTLLIDLMTEREDAEDAWTRELRFDIGFLARRLETIAQWTLQQTALAELRLGYFGSSTGGAAALLAASHQADQISAVVSRGGRPDLAAEALPEVKAPTLLIVGARDEDVLELNRRAFALLGCEKELITVPGATHLFEEPGALEEVARLAANWFGRYLADEP
jgi:pimeloyl-ACP methyl ester carboxylesterase